jgi:hypothetical protein
MCPIRHVLAVLGVSPVLVTLVYHAALYRFSRNVAKRDRVPAAAKESCGSSLIIV